MGGFLQALPAAATSPYAYAAYALALIAWVVTLWLRLRPQRETQKILADFNDEGERNRALTVLLGQAPPKGLARTEILDWVRIQSQDKTKGYLLVAYLALVFAVIVIVVVALTGQVAPSTSLPGPVIRFAAADGTQCLPLPDGVRVTVRTSRADPQEADVVGCEAKLPWAFDWRAGDAATIDIAGAGAFERVEGAKTYRLGDATWVVAMRPGASAPRLIVQLFDYASTEAGSDQQLTQFHTIVRNKFQMLAQSMSIRNPLCKYVADLRVERAPRQLASSPNATLAEWKNSGALLFLSGLFFRRESDVIVRSQPFFGDLGSEADISRIQIDLRIHANEFGRTTDTHSLALLYALAMDARRRGQPTDVVLLFLGEAVSTAQGLDSAVPGVLPLKNALQDALKAIGAPVKDTL